MANSWLSGFFSHPLGARLVYYPTLLYGILNTSAKRRWYDRIDDRVILGALPMQKVAKKLVSEENVRGVVTLNEEYETRFLCPTKEKWKELDVSLCCIPTVDFNNAPTLYQIKSSLEFIDDFRDGSSVYVHCKAGRSRSTTVVVCYLMNRYKMSPSEALQFVKHKRPHVVLGSAHSQRVDEFYRRYLSS